MGYFAERLKALRERAGYSQNVLAERAGVGVSTLRQFEYGLREPTYGTLVKIAAGLGVSLAEFDQVDAKPSPKRSTGRKPRSD